MNKKRALVVTLSNPSSNPRPNRIINLLNQKNIKVDVLSYKTNSDLPIENEFLISFINKPYNRNIRDLRKFLLTIIPFSRTKIKLCKMISSQYIIKGNISFDVYDIIIIEDIEVLPVILDHKPKGKIMCDLREFYPLQHEKSFKFKILERSYKYILCKYFLSSCHKLITVSEGISELYKKWFNLDTMVIMSCPYFANISPFVGNRNVIKMVHHGGPNKDRKLEKMIKMFYYLDNRFSLDFYLVNYYNKKYINYLKKLAKPFPQIRFLNPVPFKDIIPTMNKYDIGLYLLEPSGTNIKYSLPNKLFEYVQARLMIAIGPSIEMKKIVSKYNLGVVSNTFKPKDLANLLNNLKNEDILKFKLNSDNASKELCFEKESEKLINIINELI